MSRQYSFTRGEIKKYKLAELLPALNREVEKTRRLFQYVDELEYPEKYDHYNKYRALLPVLEAASKIEFSKEEDDSLLSLMKVLNIPESELTFYMYRHGLMHSIFPFFVDQNGERRSYGIPMGQNSEHSSHLKYLAFSPNQALRDLELYLERFKTVADLDREVPLQISVIIKDRD